jgi:phosphoserine aminotransferase
VKFGLFFFKIIDKRSMSKMIYLTPGPSQVYPGMEQFFQQAIVDDVCCISHRSSAYKAIHQKTVENLKELANLPSDFEVYFLGSATEAWERIFNNFVASNSFHFVNGSFSSKFFDYGAKSGKNSQKVKVEQGLGFDQAHFDLIPSNSELIALTHNETSSGVQMPVSDIHAIANKHKNSLVAVDMVSSFPYPDLDYTKVDTALFSVQKCMGMPAGLGVWFVGSKAKAAYDHKFIDGHLILPHHNISELSKFATEHQTPATPNVLAIYLLGKVTDDLLKKGINKVRQEFDDKYAFLNDSISQISILSHGVEKEEHRSRTVVVANTSVAPAAVNKALAVADLNVGAGYGTAKETQIRIANFPAISMTTMEKLVKELKKL